MKLYPPTIGPIVGFTSDQESRIWFRARFEASDTGFYRRCFGALRWRVAGQNPAAPWSPVLFNKMSPNFDMTCVLAPRSLRANTIYEYEVGWAFLDAELDAVESIPTDRLVWPNVVNRFKTASADVTCPRSYVVGSCRYLLKTFIGDVFDDRGDKIFGSILGQHVGKVNDGAMRLDGIMMMGDQIYADDLNFIAPDRRLGEYLERYRTVFSQDYIRKLMANLPTYMILDDHEIEDNWPAKASDRDRATIYPHAIHAYQIYQCSHSPLFTLDANGRINGTLQHFWYSFSDGCVDWFVTDSRTERVVSGLAKRMFKDQQMNALLEWLEDDSGRVKMIVTSVPFVPDLRSDDADKWDYFPEQRNQILEAITRLRGKSKVVFVSGDVHCSYTAEIRHAQDPKPVAWQIVSSSFFWPYPHMHKGDFAAMSGVYDARFTSDIIADDNFARLDISPQGIDVSFFPRKGGKPLASVEIRF